MVDGSEIGYLICMCGLSLTVVIIDRRILGMSGAKYEMDEKSTILY